MMKEETKKKLLGLLVKKAEEEKDSGALTTLVYCIVSLSRESTVPEKGE